MMKHKETYRVLLERRAVLAIRELRSVLRKVGKTSDGEVLLVGIARADSFLGLEYKRPKRPNVRLARIQSCDAERFASETHLLHCAEDIGLSVSVPVRTHTEVNLPRVLVRLECLRDTCRPSFESNQSLNNPNIEVPRVRALANTSVP